MAQIKTLAARIRARIERPWRTGAGGEIYTHHPLDFCFYFYTYHNKAFKLIVEVIAVIIQVAVTAAMTLHFLERYGVSA